MDEVRAAHATNFRRAFDWVLSRIVGGPPGGPAVVSYNGDALVQSEVVSAVRLRIHYDVYYPKRVLSVLGFTTY